MPAGRKAKIERRRERERERVKIRRSLADNFVIRFVLKTKRWRSQAKSVITGCVLCFSKRSLSFFQLQLAASSSTTVSATERPNLDGVPMSCLERSPTWHTNTILDVHTEVQLSHLFPHRSPFWAQRSSFSCEEKGFHVQSLGSLKLIVFVFPVSVTACRGLAISCVTQNVKTSVFRWVCSLLLVQVHYVGYRPRWLVWYLENGPRLRLGPFSRYQTATSDDILYIQPFLISTYKFGQRKNSLLSRLTC